jgi:hypothetical protein
MKETEKECMCGRLHINVYTCDACWNKYKLDDVIGEMFMKYRYNGGLEDAMKKYVMTLPPNRKKKLAAI